jgi:hypothetical protein
LLQAFKRTRQKQNVHVVQAASLAMDEAAAALGGFQASLDAARLPGRPALGAELARCLHGAVCAAVLEERAPQLLAEGGEAQAALWPALADAAVAWERTVRTQDASHP